LVDDHGHELALFKALAALEEVLVEPHALRPVLAHRALLELQMSIEHAVQVAAGAAKSLAHRLEVDVLLTSLLDSPRIALGRPFALDDTAHGLGEGTPARAAGEATL